MIKRRCIRETAKTYDAAKIALSRLHSQVDEDRHPKTAITVGQAITRWLEVAKLGDTTRERHQDLIGLYICPRSARCRPAGSTRNCWSGSTRR